MKDRFKKVIKKADLVSYYFYMRIANILLQTIYKTNITPNIVTIFSIIFGIVAGILYSNSFTIFGLVIFTFSYTLDCLDGQLARFKNLHSEFGLWFDNTGDRITEAAVIIGLSLGYLELEEIKLGLFLIALNIVYWYAHDILYHQSRALNIKSKFVKRIFILRVLNPLISKGSTVLLLSISPLLSVEYIFIMYIIIYLIKIPELIFIEYKKQLQ
jgi:phosphatidylglycerophosphate synthase